MNRLEDYPDFKEGIYTTCLSNKRPNQFRTNVHLTEGEIYKVIEFENNGYSKRIMVKNDLGEFEVYSTRRFDFDKASNRANLLDIILED